MKYCFAFIFLVISGVGFSASFESNIETENIVFLSHQTKLSGSLVLPKDIQSKAAVVFVHGSGKSPRFLQLAKRLAQKGIAAFVYDKRGVGDSGGRFEGKNPVSEKNLDLLADDAAAALQVLVKHPKLQNAKFGIIGLSQAGWIVPIAAVKSPMLDYIVLWSGPVTKVSEEDILSKYTNDKDSTTVPTFADALAARKAPYVWPAFLGKDTDPSESLSQLDIPGLWIFGKQDGSIPVDLSISNLEQLNKNGHSYEYVLFSNAGHMNIDKSLPLVVDWINSQG